MNNNIDATGIKATVENGELKTIEFKTDNIMIGDRMYKLVPVEPEKKPWPQDGDKYWYISAIGDVYASSFDDVEIDCGVLAIGNMYQTEQQAKDALRAKKLIKTINDRRKELNGDWVANWEVCSMQPKYCIKNIGADIRYDITSICAAYPFGTFKNKQDCEQVIDKYRPDLLWYFTEYLPEVTK